MTIEKKCSDCVHLWVKFSIQNITLRVSRSKRYKIFPAGPFFFLYLTKCYRSDLVSRSLPRLEKFLVARACITNLYFISNLAWIIFKGQLGLTICSYHVTYSFQSESTLYSCLNIKELLARNRRDISNLSDCNGTQTHNHVVRKRTLNHLAKLVPVTVRFLSFVCILYQPYIYSFGFVRPIFSLTAIAWKVSVFRSFSSPYFPAFGLNKEIRSITQCADRVFGFLAHFKPISHFYTHKVMGIGMKQWRETMHK